MKNNAFFLFIFFSLIIKKIYVFLSAFYSLLLLVFAVKKEW